MEHWFKVIRKKIWKLLSGQTTFQEAGFKGLGKVSQAVQHLPSKA
jgi:hypothetical protein